RPTLNYWWGSVSLILAQRAMHTHLFTVYFIPYLAIGIYVFLKNFEKKTFSGIVAGISVAIMVPAIFYTSYYLNLARI
ncbi:MAG: hypothetical protein WCO89_14150, partial [Syntrophus sp. (in: bacteria)]